MAGKKAHFIGICGAGMSGAALLLREAGWEVSGSDDGFYPPVSDLLRKAGLPCLSPYAADNIPPDADLIVIGKHAKLVPESNTEVRRGFELRDAGQAEIKSYPEALDELTRERHSIVVAGSYGKSSTTALLGWILADSGKDPGYFIGAVPIDFDTNARLGSGAYFVLEGDEYPSANWDSTSKFLYYHARTVVLTSGEYDHFNEFPNEDAYLEPYRRLVGHIPRDGLLAACLDGAHVREIRTAARCRVVTYSGRPDAGADYTAGEPAFEGTRSRFEIRRPGDTVVHVETVLFGEHNLQNIAGAAAALFELHAVTPEEFARSISRFRGLRRRLELKTERSSVATYEDLSSSRPKAMAALGALRQRYPGARIHAVFQPHTFSFRSRKALEWYPGMFQDADSVLIFSPPDLRGLASEEELSHEEIVAAIRSGNRAPVETVTSPAETVNRLRSSLDPGDVVLLMTSGGMGGAIPSIVGMTESDFSS